jgi:hypothetical protein
VNARLAFPGLSAAAALALVACAATPATPDDPFKAADTDIEQAEYARAADYASPEMHSAREKLSAARQMEQKAEQDKNDPAEKRQAVWLAQEADADAELAEAKAADVRAQGALRQLQAAPLPGAQP